MEQLEKLDVQTLRLGEEAPRRVCYSRDMCAYGVAFLRETLDRTKGEITRASSFKVLGKDSFEGRYTCHEGFLGLDGCADTSYSLA